MVSTNFIMTCVLYIVLVHVHEDVLFINLVRIYDVVGRIKKINQTIL